MAFKLRALLVFAGLLNAVVASAMPPFPRPGGYSSLPTGLKNPGLLTDSIHRPHNPSTALGSSNCAAGEMRAVVALVQFPAASSETISAGYCTPGEVARAKQLTVPASYYYDLAFNPTPSISSLKHYYADQLKNALDITPGPSITSANIAWNTAPKCYSYYLNDGLSTTGDSGTGADYGMAPTPFNLPIGASPRNSEGLAIDVARALDATVDFSQYDCNNDGEIDALIVIAAGTGAEGEINRSPATANQHMRSHKGDAYGRGVQLDGVMVGDYTIQPEFYYDSLNVRQAIRTGTIAHEFGHILGLIDLYDTDGSSYGIGMWSLMGYGSWNGSLGNQPAPLDAWSRLRANFGEVKLPASEVLVVNADAAATLDTITDGGKITKFLTQSSDEYYLVENRARQSNYERGFFSSGDRLGLMVWRVSENAVDNTNEAKPKVSLLQADGLNALETRANYGDLGDLYPGPNGSYQTLNQASYPNTRRADGLDSGASLQQIGFTGTRAVSVNLGIREDFKFVPQRFASIQQAVNQAANNDSIFVEGATKDRFAVSGKSLKIIGIDSGTRASIDGLVLQGQTRPADCPYAQGDDYFLDNGVCQPLIKLTNSSLTIENLELKNSLGGGAVVCKNSAMSINKSVFRSNQKHPGRSLPLAESYGIGKGAGIYSENCSGLIENSHFIDNFAQAGGGALIELGGTMIVRNNLFSENDAAAGSGLVYFGSHGSTVQVSNNTFTQNTNRALWVYFYLGDTVRVLNNISHGNAVCDLALDSLNGQIPTVERNLFGDVCYHPATIFRVPASNFIMNASEQVFRNAAGGDFHLVRNSAAIDAADGAFALATDINGVSRFDDTYKVNTGTGIPNYVDLGAYENNWCSSASGGCASQSSPCNPKFKNCSVQVAANAQPEI